MKLKRARRSLYVTGFFLLFSIELVIAVFIKDGFVRPYLGDFLVVIMIYCFLMAITNFAVIRSLVVVLIFSFALEFFQMLNIVKIMQYQPPNWVMVVLGSSFSVWDLLAYSLGLAAVGLLESSKAYLSEKSSSTITGK